MAISEELKVLYSANPVGKRFYETVEISHSMFSKTYYLVQDSIAHSWKLEDDSTVEFIAFGFDIRLPEVGSPQQDLSFVFDNVGREAMPELEAAATVIDEPIKLVYRVYMDGFDSPQTSTINLVLTNIVADNFTISATATRPDLYKRFIPTGNKSLYDNRFYGLFV